MPLLGQMFSIYLYYCKYLGTMNLWSSVAVREEERQK
jgi:hypothetical protein